MNNIKNIVFDLGVVIINLNRERCIEAFKALGLDEMTFNSIQEVEQNIFNRYELGEISSEEFCNQVRSILNKNIENEEIEKAWLKMLCDIPQYKLEAIRGLNKKYRVFLLSNTNEIHWQWCKDIFFENDGFELSDYFEDVFLSYEMHLMKPDKKIFERLTAKTGIACNETIFIDDSDINCLSAMNLGFKTYTAKKEENWTYLFNSKQ
ncbi:MAG: HAD family phosphatase [Bacteroidales bacterium]|nr:HAD family phosphatase [Bacteroidales bacterium]